MLLGRVLHELHLLSGALPGGAGRHPRIRSWNITLHLKGTVARDLWNALNLGTEAKYSIFYQRLVELLQDRFHSEQRFYALRFMYWMDLCMNVTNLRIPPRFLNYIWNRKIYGIGPQSAAILFLKLFFLVPNRYFGSVSNFQRVFEFLINSIGTSFIYVTLYR